MAQNVTENVFQSIYGSVWTTTIVVAVAAFAFCLAWMRRQPFITAFVAVWTIEIVFDALVAGTGTSWLSPEVASTFGLVLVLAGDFRFWFLVERWSQKPHETTTTTTTASPSVWLAAFLFAAVAPFVSSLLLPSDTVDMRWTFLAYEASFVVFALLVRFVVMPRRLRSTTPAVRTWLTRLMYFELLQYALWVTADVIILAGHDVGYALRIVPNVMYYALFIPFAAFSAPLPDRADDVDHAGAPR